MARSGVCFLLKLNKFFYCLLVGLAIFLNGCSKKIEMGQDFKINTDIDSFVTVTDDSGQVCACEFVNTPQKITNIKFISPESLKNLSLESISGKFEIFYNGLKCESNKNFFTENSAISRVIDVINSINDADDECKEISDTESDDKKLFVINYKNDSENCQLYVDNNGNVKKIIFPDVKTTVEFSVMSNSKVDV